MTIYKQIAADIGVPDVVAKSIEHEKSGVQFQTGLNQ